MFRVIDNDLDIDCTFATIRIHVRSCVNAAALPLHILETNFTAQVIEVVRAFPSPAATFPRVWTNHKRITGIDLDFGRLVPAAIVNLGIRNDRACFARAASCIFNDHRNDGLFAYSNRNRFVCDINISIIFECSRERKAVDFSLLAYCRELAQVKRVFCIARARIQHHEHKRTVFADGGKRIAVIAIDKARTWTNRSAKCSVHVESRCIRERLLFVICGNRAPVLGRVRKLPINPGVCVHVAEVMQNHIRHPKRNVEVATAMERS